MELSFTELDNLDKQNINEQVTIPQNLNKYNIASEVNSIHRNNTSVLKVQPVNVKSVKPIKLTPKKNLSYDDILSSMNTIVVDGKLEFISKDKLNNIVENKNKTHNQYKSESEYHSHNQTPYKKRVTFNDKPTPQQPMDKNSYIYNKFFKNYKDPYQEQQDEIVQRPLTKKELINQIVINKIKSVNERNRIAQIKSTKLLFNNNNNHNIVVKTMQNQSNLNHLFRFK